MNMKNYFLKQALITGILLMLFNVTTRAQNPPVVLPDTFSIVVGDTLIFNIFDHSYDPDGDNYSTQRWDPPVHGELMKLSDSLFRVVMTQNYQGIDSMMFRLREENTNILTEGYLYLDVASNAQYPFAVNDTVDAWQGDTVRISVLSNDYDLQGDPLMVMNAESEHANLFLDFNDSLISLVPYSTTEPGFYHYFSYLAQETGNPAHVSNPAGGYINLHANPHLPVAVNDTVQAIAGFPVEISPLLNDYDPDGDTLIIENVHCSYETGFCEYTDSLVTFTPYSNLSGKILLTYWNQEKNNAAHISKIVKIVVQVAENQDPPVANDDYITMNAFDTLTFNPLLNDADPDGLDIRIDRVWQSPGAHASISGDSLVSIISLMNFRGTIDIPYQYYRTENPAMVSNKGLIHVEVIPDESRFYGITDTIRDWPGLNGSIDIIANDYNPGSDSLVIGNVYQNYGADVWKAGDSIAGYAIGFTTNQPVQATYTINMPGDSLESMGRIYIVPNEKTDYTAELDLNNIRARFSTVGMHFYDPLHEDEPGQFEVPKGSGKNTLHSNTLWIGGLSGDQLHLAAERYRWFGADFWPGPISETYQNEDLAGYRVWKITSGEIAYHIAHYTDPDYEPIEAIATWPGNGNPELGQAEQLAPYFDQNGDGIYNAYDGDVPLIRGDQSLYFIFNDGYAQHRSTMGSPMNIEIHGNAWAYDNPGDSALFNTVFLHYDVINRSENTYEDTYMGLFNDFDLGYPYDNYIGTDVTRGNTYVYNGTPVDGQGESSAYGANPPVQGVVMLGGATLPADNQDNPQGGCNESINGLNFGDGIVDNERMGLTRSGNIYKAEAYPNTIPDPQDAPEYYQYLAGRWKDNTPWLYGGNGHEMNPETVGPQCRFMFPGASDPLNWGTGCEFPNGGFNQNGKYWTEESAQNRPNGRRGISCTGPFTFAPGEVQSLDIAYVYARDNDTTDNVSAIDIMNQRIDTLRNRVLRGEIIYLPEYSVGITENDRVSFEVSVYPNPSSGGQVFVDLRKSGLTGTANYQIRDIVGRTIAFGALKADQATSISTANLDSGIYLLVIESENRRALQKLVIRR